MTKLPTTGTDETVPQQGDAADPMKTKVKYVTEDRDRHGNVRLYFRRPGQRKVRLRGPAGTPEFWQDYQDAIEGKLLPADAVKRYDPTSLDWLCDRYFRSPTFIALDSKTQAQRRGILNRFCDIEQGGRRNGTRKFADLQPRHIRAQRDEMAATPTAANQFVKVLRRLFAFAQEYELVKENPTTGVTPLSHRSDGFHSWTLDELRQFESFYPIGTKQRLAYTMALYTTQRRSDIVAIGKQHVKNGRIKFTQAKNRNRSPVTLDIPIHPELQRVIDATECGDLAFLVNQYGRPYTVEGLGTQFRRWCNDAGLPNCSLHGLRKAATSLLAEQERTEEQLKSVTGIRNSETLKIYTRNARQNRLADQALTGFKTGGEEE